MIQLRVRDSIMTLSTVWHRAIADALLNPRRFRKVMPEFRKVSDMLVHPGIGSVDVGSLPVTEEPIKLLSLTSIYGVMPAQDLYALLRIVRWLQPKRIFEIGTFQGVTTAHLAINSQAEIFTLDLPRELAADLRGYTDADRALLQPRENIGHAYRPFNSGKNIHQLFGDSRAFDYSPYHGSMDLVLVDACHLFDYVLSDSRHALRLLNQRGIILWHDFGTGREVVRALQVLAKEHTIVHIEGTALAVYCRGLSLFESNGANEAKPAIGQVA